MFDPHLSVGQVLTEKEVHDTFQCQTTLGIRMSKKNNLFVIMSGSAKSKIYDDVWKDDVLYYNGTDINSDSSANQTLTKGKGNNNSQLCAVWDEPEDSKHQIFLFVKREQNKCIYKGEVFLCQKPYMDFRHDDPTRKVWIFPLKLKALEADKLEKDFQTASKNAYLLDYIDLYNRVKGKAANKQPDTVPKQYKSTHTTYERNPEIAAFAKIRANGVCDLCKMPAPFNDKDGRPYMEAHHVVWLSNGGPDEIDNVVALCPNCHKKMHIVADINDEQALLKRLLAYQKMMKK